MIFRKGSGGRTGRPMGDDALLIEAAAGAHRARDAWGNVIPSSDWADLTPAAREAAFELQMESRAIEALLDPEGIDTTGRAIMKRIEGVGQD
ncbi:MAG: hypothetical protein HY049_15935 [Acidobacteria bacterium]|nr:hypothetical protein [Acidobacteriota bacterium]